jgi:hypothetical protein
MGNDRRDGCHFIDHYPVRGFGSEDGQQRDRWVFATRCIRGRAASVSDDIEIGSLAIGAEFEMAVGVRLRLVEPAIGAPAPRTWPRITSAANVCEQESRPNTAEPISKDMVLRGPGLIGRTMFTATADLL